jgi:HK97 family phage major capsid protein
MKTLAELRARKDEIVKELDVTLKTADEEKRELTEDEEKRYDVLDEELNGINDEIAKREKTEGRRKRVDEERAKLDASVNKPTDAPAVHTEERGEVDPEKEFRGIGEILHSVVYKPNDPRLNALYDTREQSMADGVAGGFMIPKQFMDELMGVTPDTNSLRQRCRVIPAGSPPDAAISIPVLDQTADENMYGGVQVDWIEEGGTKPETDARFQEIELKPKEVAGHIVATDKLLRNWTAADSILGQLLMNAKNGAEDYAVYTGSGVGQPLGVLNAQARINVTRAGVNAISYDDVVNMLARLLRRGGNPVWFCNQTIIPQLANLTDTNNNNIFVFDASQGMADTLMGFPIIYNERVNSLGSVGDLSLLDMSNYLLKEGSGPFIATSEHVHFTRNKTVIKMFWNVDGQPWLREPIKLEAGSATRGKSASTNTVSPFIVLN